MNGEFYTRNNNKLLYDPILCRFQYFYPKTGVTGPYVFGAGLATYLFSKEIYVMEHEYYSGLSILLMVVFATKKFGPGLAAYLDKEVDVSQ